MKNERDNEGKVFSIISVFIIFVYVSRLCILVILRVNMYFLIVLLFRMVLCIFLGNGLRLYYIFLFVKNLVVWKRSMKY